MVHNDPKMKEVFPQPPIIAYKRQKNLREALIRAKVPPAYTRPKRKLPGMKRCNNCVYCPYIMTGDHVKFTASKQHHQITTTITCTTGNWTGLDWTHEARVARLDWTGLLRQELQDWTGLDWTLEARVARLDWTLEARVERLDWTGL